MTPECDRRGDSDSDGPPTMMMQAYTRLDEPTRVFFRKVGLSMVLISVLIPMIGGIWYKFETAWWMMTAAIFSVGVCFTWPPFAIWAVSSIPSGLSKFVPFTKRPERRSASRTDSQEDERP